MGDLAGFLRGRNVPEELIQKLEEDKIDHSVLPLMDDEALKKYIPSYGDRIAATAFCRMKTGKPMNETEEVPSHTQRSPLMNRLMASTSRHRRGNAFEQYSLQPKKARNASKPSRRLNLGWMNFDCKTQSYRQVRRRNGGGTRQLDIQKSMGSAEILSVGLGLFFPEGKSKFGPMSDFIFNVMDSQLNDIGPNTIEQLYEKTRYSLLHLYVCSKSAKPASNAEDAEQKSTDQHGLDTTHQDNSAMPIDTDSDGDLPSLNTFSTQSGRNSPDNTIDSAQNENTQEDNDQHLDELPDLIVTGTPTVVFNPRRLTLTRRRGALAGPLPVTPSQIPPDTLSKPEVPIDPGSSKDPESTHAVLTRLSSKVVIGQRNIINVTRECVFTGAIRGFQRKTFDDKRQLSVKFSGEAAIDEGGPSREFLRLLMVEIRSMPIFSGPETRRSLDLNYAALRAGTYATVGRMIAYSIVHRGPLPQFLSSVTFEALVEGVEGVHPEIADIADENYRTKIQEVACAEDVSTFFKAIDAAEDLIELAGCFHLATSPDKRTDLAAALTHFLVLGRAKQCFDQFCSGLESLGVLQEIKANSLAMREVFTDKGGNKLTAAIIENMFEVAFSEPGSNKRRQEETTAANWRDFLLDIEEGNENVSLETILMFATGADSIPPLGFIPTPSLKFHHLLGLGPEDAENFPFGNTCGNILDVPVICDFELFKKNMSAALNVQIFTSE